MDMVILRYSARINGLTHLAITKLDVLTGLDSIRLCIAYEYQGKQLESVPAKLSVLSACRPIYEEMDGWKEDISEARGLEELPKNARNYIKRIETLIDVRASIISVGPGREETIVNTNPFGNS